MKKIIFLLALLTLSVPIFAQTVYTYYPINLNTPVNLNGVSSNLIVGDNGKIFRNSGLGWVEQNSGTIENLNWINQRGDMVAGNNGVLLKYSGGSWTRINTGSNINFKGFAWIVATNPPPTIVRYIAIGDNGLILISSNQGVNWTQVNSNTTENLNSFCSIGALDFKKHIWIAANGGNVIRSTDGGSSWTKIYTGSNHNLNDIYFKDTLNGITVGVNGIIKRTFDGGLTWGNIPSPTPNTLKSIDNGISICGDNGTILKTTDFGSTFTKDSVGFTTNLNDILGDIAVGNNGKAYQRQLDSLYMKWTTISGNNLKVYVNNSGVIGQNMSIQNSPGFEWPAGSGKHLVFTNGMSIAAKYQGALRMAVASFKGEYKPGYTGSMSNFTSDNRFKIYKVKKSDSPGSSWDYDNWGLMVPFGAPYIDVNHNGVYNPGVDKPGIQGAAETIFMSLTDSDPASHTTGEGFGGGTQPLYCDLRLTLWTYDIAPLKDALFIKYKFINKSFVQWTNVYIGNFFDPDLGDSDDDYISCDTLRNLGIAYNADNEDSDYGVAPPAFGSVFLKTPQNFGMKFFVPSYNHNPAPAPCVAEPTGDPLGAYNVFKGLKKDGTPWMLHQSNPLTPVRYIFSGDPESNSGWTEKKGMTIDCGGGNPIVYNIMLPGERRMLMNTGAENFNMNPNDTAEIVSVQFAARGNTNLNSVTRLKQLADSIKTIYNNGFSIEVNPISQIIPDKFNLYQNYPNPFNPVTNIKFDVPKKTFITLEVFDVSGRLISVMVKKEVEAGQYEVSFEGMNLSSGIYFYRLKTDAVMMSKKMLLLK